MNHVTSFPTADETTVANAFDDRAASPPFVKVQIGAATLYLGDSAAVLPYITGVDACVADGPYGLSFMGKAWDYDVPTAGFWSLVWNALKPGAHLVNFASARTYHRMAVQVEDGGFDIRDQLLWVYGSGFPKSHDVSKAIDKTLGAKRQVVGTHGRIGYNALAEANGVQTCNVTQWDRTSAVAVTAEAQQWQGYGTALKPAHEPIVLARKPFKGSVANNVLKHGTGGLNIAATRVPTSGGDAAKHKAAWNSATTTDIRGGAYNSRKQFPAFES